MPQKVHVWTKFNDRVIGPLQQVFPEAEIIGLESDSGFEDGLAKAEFLLTLKPPRTMAEGHKPETAAKFWCGDRQPAAAGWPQG